MTSRCHGPGFRRSRLKRLIAENTLHSGLSHITSGFSRDICSRSPWTSSGLDESQPRTRSRLGRGPRDPPDFGGNP
eukprot:1591107-Pyramimonas_sp.AAC.1